MHCRAPGRRGHDDRRERNRERDRCVPAGQAVGSVAGIDSGEQVILEKLRRQIRAADQDRSAQRKVEPVSNHGQGHTDQQRGGDGANRHQVQSFVKAIQHQRGAADGVGGRTIQA